MLAWTVLLVTTARSPHDRRAAFATTRPATAGRTPWSRTALHGGSSSSDDDARRYDGLSARVRALRERVAEEEARLPPRPALAPCAVVRSVLAGLAHADDPRPEAGYRLLLRASTPRWRGTLAHAVGAPGHADEDAVASALGAALRRPNQFRLLVEEDDTRYDVTFPSDVVDFEDGACWLECRLWDESDGSLLVVMGWQLQRRIEDGAWLVDGLDWQDFRDDYRPGIGREEWMRICG